MEWVLFGLIGGVFVFGIPPFQKPDEVVHFYKTVAVSQGQWMCQETNNEIVGHKIPQYLYDLPSRLLTEEIAHYTDKKIPIARYKEIWQQNIWDNRKVMDTSSCPLNPLFYLIPGIFIAIPVALNFHPLLIFYVGRLVMWGLFVLAWGWSLENAPKKVRPILWLWGLLPMTLNQVTAYNKDGLHLMGAMVAFSLYCRAIVDRKTMDRRRWVLMALGLILTVITRWQYAPILWLLMTVLPKGKGENDKKKLVILGILTTATWLLSVGIISKHLNALNNNPYIKYVYPIEQMRYIFNYPGDMIKIIFNSWWQQGEFYWESMWGILGWLDMPLNSAVYYGLTGLTAILVYRLSRQILIEKKIIVSLIMVAGLIMVVDLTSLYIYWTPVGAKTVEGIQGRYFLGFWPYLIIAIAAIVAKMGKKKILIGTGLIMGGLILGSIYERYYNLANYYQTDEETTMGVNFEVRKNIRFVMPVDSHKKMIGITTTEMAEEILIPYKSQLKDEQCQKTLGELVMSADNFGENTSTDWVYKGYQQGSEKVCIEMEPLFEPANGQYLQIKSISPIYRI